MAACVNCLKTFPMEFEEQGQWFEFRKATGGPGLFVCPECAAGCLFPPGLFHARANPSRSLWWKFWHWMNLA